MAWARKKITPSEIRGQFLCHLKKFAGQQRVLLPAKKNHPSGKRGVGKINPEGFCPKGRGLLFLLLETETEIAATGLELGGAFLAECHTPF